MKNKKNSSPILSIIVPTRDSIKLLGNFIDSIKNTVFDKNNIELVFVVDKDDQKTITFLKGHSYINDMKFVQLLIRPQSTNFSRDYYTYGAKHATGVFVTPGADDLKFNTKHFDSILIQTEKDLKPDPNGCDPPTKFYLLTVTGPLESVVTEISPSYTMGITITGDVPSDISLPMLKFCCFPILTKESIDLLGFFLAPEEVPGWGADWVIDQIYRMADRIIETTPPIEILHDSWHAGNRDVLSTIRHRRMKRISESTVSPQVNDEVILKLTEATVKLKNAIHGLEHKWSTRAIKHAVAVEHVKKQKKDNI